MLAKRFPYAIYYEIKDEIAYVVAVLPMRRDPLYYYSVKAYKKNKLFEYPNLLEI